MIVPTIDTSIGMEVYSTNIEGISGSIKGATDEFIVEELVDSTSFDLTKNVDEEHTYPLYLLQKEGIDSVHAIKEVELATRLKLKVLGLKDAKAITKQYVSSVRKYRDAKTYVMTKHCSLELLGYTRRPITKRELTGNRFTITVTGFTYENMEQSRGELEEMIHKNCIANFFGYQRFGSSRAVTHLIGREIVKRNFKEAIELFICYPGRYDSEETREIRELCKDSSNFQNVLKTMPTRMDLERILLQELVNNNDPVRALRKLPITIRRLLVQSYQSYLFNRSLSKVIKEGYDIALPRSGDVCFRFSNNSVVGIKKFDYTTSVIQLPAIPLVGYAFKDNNRFSSILKSIMEEENISKNDFYIKEMQEVSVEGGFRHTSLLCNKFSHSLHESLKLNFILNKGCYATILLRELMKPIDPIAAGF
ncbi:MAG: tRNA pseudouridine(13) synthase TruD [Thaumarchaeota archaeon]|nr:tRNA pseudouridine(13) synthase TruD [Nitrososphaerota archaeon]